MLVSSLSILAVWRALGGGPVRYGRARAFWRDGDGWNISLREQQGVWYDHRDNRGGGILDLVQTAQACGRREALLWLGEYFGIPLPSATPQERKEWARRRAAAEQLSSELEEWREERLRILARYRDLHLDLFHAAKGRIIHGCYAGDEELESLLETADRAEETYQAADEALGAWRQAGWDEALAIFRSSNGRIRA